MSCTLDLMDILFLLMYHRILKTTWHQNTYWWCFSEVLGDFKDIQHNEVMSLTDFSFCKRFSEYLKSTVPGYFHHLFEKTWRIFLRYLRNQCRIFENNLSYYSKHISRKLENAFQDNLKTSLTKYWIHSEVFLELF